MNPKGTGCEDVDWM